MTKKLKILQFVTKRQYRGAEVFAANLSNELTAIGHEVIFAGLYRNEGQELQIDNGLNLDLVNRKKGKLSIHLISKIIKLVKETNPDVIQCNGSDTLKYVILASFFFPKKAILYRNISTISEWFSSPLQMSIYKFLFQRVDHITSVGENARKDLIETFGIAPEKVTVIRRGIPIKKIDKDKAARDLRNELQIDANCKVVVHVGNFSPEKNHSFLLEVFEHIKNSENDIKLLCVGNGILFDEIRSQIKKRDLSDTVYLLGFRKDIPELIAGGDLFVLCSKVEGVPGVILEAAAQKVPSLSVDVGGVREVLENHETGIIVSGYNHQEFAVRIHYLMSNDSKRKKMGEKAYEKILDEFDPQRNALKFEYLYLKMYEMLNS